MFWNLFLDRYFLDYIKFFYLFMILFYNVLSFRYDLVWLRRNFYCWNLWWNYLKFVLICVLKIFCYVVRDVFILFEVVCVWIYC